MSEGDDREATSRLENDEKKTVETDIQAEGDDCQNAIEEDSGDCANYDIDRAKTSKTADKFFKKITSAPDANDCGGVLEWCQETEGRFKISWALPEGSTTTKDYIALCYTDLYPKIECSDAWCVVWLAWRRENLVAEVGIRAKVGHDFECAGERHDIDYADSLTRWAAAGATGRPITSDRGSRPSSHPQLTRCGPLSVPANCPVVRFYCRIISKLALNRDFVVGD
ncbi:hypothetical protein EVAR_26012_1 [Eumeta japonica]|uniref:Uncharacterized protein n=1 Tax=Eumeta variegata TaxID=151549 RepID=A0A4C1VRB5_EUMVA|nr:hypothetical protein EVAR_26012_1 [Eumeta japonica]